MSQTRRRPVADPSEVWPVMPQYGNCVQDSLKTAVSQTRRRPVADPPEVWPVMLQYGNYMQDSLKTPCRRPVADPSQTPRGIQDAPVELRAGFIKNAVSQTRRRPAGAPPEVWPVTVMPQYGNYVQDSLKTPPAFPCMPMPCPWHAHRMPMARPRGQTVGP